MSFNVRVGDTGPRYTSVLGASANLANADVVTFRFRLRGGARKEGVATIDDASTGTVGYDWAADDLDHAGTLDCVWHVLYLDGTEQTFPATSDGSFEEVNVWDNI